MMIKTILKNRTAQNAGWLIAGRIIQMLISFFVGILTARYLGPSNYGLINYAGAYIAFFTSVCTLGINSVIVNELINHRTKEGEVLGTALLLKAVASFLSSVIIVLIVFVVDFGETDTILITALCCVGLILNVLETMHYWFQSHLLSKYSAIATLIGYVVISAYKIFLMVFGKSVVHFAISTSLDYLCVGILLLCFYKKEGGAKLHFSWEYGKSLLKKSYHFILPSLMVSIYAQTDKIMLKNMISEAEIGYYSTAITLCTTWCFILTAIIDSIYPSIMEAYKQKNYELFNKRNKILYAIVFYVSIAVSLAFCLLSSPIIRILYGNAYLPSVGPLRVITWYTAFSYLGVARNAWIVCENKQKYLIWIYLSAAITNVLMNLCFIPILGAIGAAIASLVSQIITTMVTPFFIRELRPNVKLMVEAITLKGIIRHNRKV